MTDDEHHKQTISRKQQHVELCVDENVTFRTKTAGFEKYEFEHNALPELNYSEISLETNFFSKKISSPLMISCMTGGYPDAEKINAQLAEICQQHDIPMGVGSQRQAIENSAFHDSFRVVRKFAPKIPVVGNIGAAEIAKKISFDSIKKIIDLIEADAIAVHLNPLQELLQPEGTPDFRGVLAGIEELAKEKIPVIVKEVGAGISASVAKKLLDAGVAGIDVAGAGGTSWAGVELLRNEERKFFEEFWDWGIPTAECVKEISPMKKEKFFVLISSGGITSGMDIAKSIALGADLGSSARPFLKTLLDEGQQQLSKKISLWQRQIRHVMFLTGSANISELQKAKLHTIS